MMNRHIKYPIGIQSFEALRKEGYVYVDKTHYIPMLLENKYYFLSRPRRFGKSLLLSTLEAYFQGKAELFRGLAIEKWEKEWVKYPVVHIDFNIFHGEDIASLMAHLQSTLVDIAEANGINASLEGTYEAEGSSAAYMFAKLVRLLYEKQGRGVVILIDEYDKGILEVMHDSELLHKATSALRPFFNVLKSCDKYIKFAFITGVSRFRNTTLFSGFNNPLDISFDAAYASLLGISHAEILKYLSPSVQGFAEAHNWTVEEALEELRNRYDGYRFTRLKEYLYNPFSLLNALRSKELKNYWIATGSSLSLARHLKESKFRLDELTSRWVSEENLAKTYTSEDPISLLFQTGYLTISDYDGTDYMLKIPNQEVQSTLVNLVIPEFVQATENRGK